MAEMEGFVCPECNVELESAESLMVRVYIDGFCRMESQNSAICDTDAVSLPLAHRNTTNSATQSLAPPRMSLTAGVSF